MKKRLLSVLLAVSVLFAQTMPAFAEEILLIEEDMTDQVLDVEPITESSTDTGLSVNNAEEIEIPTETEGETVLETESEIETEMVTETETELLSEVPEAQSEDISEESEMAQDEMLLDNIIIEDIEIETDMLAVEQDAEITEYAAGNSIATATPISLGRNYSGTISSANRVDYYKFSIPSSGKINIITSAYMSQVDYYIYDSSGAERWHIIPKWNNVTKIISTNSNVDLTKGTYYFAISRYNYSTSSPNGNYSFVINFTSANESFTETGSGSNNSMSSANAISLNSEYRGQIAKNDQIDFYKFVLPKSGQLGLAASAKISELDYYIYDSAGTELWHIIPRWNSTTELISTAEIIDLTAGVYYFAVSRYGYSTSLPTGNYSFKLSYTDSGESFAESGNGTNNTIYTANPIAMQTTYQGQIAENDSKDFYKFTVASSGKTVVTVNAGIYEVYFKIYDSAGKEKWSTNQLWNRTTQKIDFSKEVELEAGAYYFVIERYSHYTGNYSFSLSAHVHSYTDTVTKATTSSNGKIVRKCACGAEGETLTIYRPSDASLSPSSYTYDGKAKRPSITVWGSDGNVISPANYTLTYGSGRKKVGSYSVKISFRGNYSGTMWKYFYIYPKKTRIKKLTAKSKGFSVKVDKKTKQVSGYQIQYSTNKRFKNAKSKYLSGNSKVSVTCSGLKAKKKYYVRVRTYKKVGGSRYYSGWSNVKTIVTKR